MLHDPADAAFEVFDSQIDVDFTRVGRCIHEIRQEIGDDLQFTSCKQV
jgi:hypothetical protein